MKSAPLLDVISPLILTFYLYNTNKIEGGAVSVSKIMGRIKALPCRVLLLGSLGCLWVFTGFSTRRSAAPYHHVLSPENNNPKKLPCTFCNKRDSSWCPWPKISPFLICELAGEASWTPSSIPEIAALWCLYIKFVEWFKIYWDENVQH